MSLEIKGGILRKYRGDEPEVDIPDGVLAIDEYAFRGTDESTLREVVSACEEPNAQNPCERQKGGSVNEGHHQAHQ